MSRDQPTHLPTSRFEVDCSDRPATAEVSGRAPDVVIVGAAVPLNLAPTGCRGYCKTRIPSYESYYGPPPGWRGDPVRRTCIERSTTSSQLAVPDAKAFNFPDAMHGYVMEQPERFADVVVPFLTR